MIDDILNGNWILGTPNEPIGLVVICYHGTEQLDGSVLNGVYIARRVQEGWQSNKLLVDIPNLDGLIADAYQQEFDIIHLGKVKNGWEPQHLSTLYDALIQYVNMVDSAHN